MIRNNNNNAPSLAPVARPRRALGDITNTAAPEEVRDPVKKTETRAYMNRPVDNIDAKDDSNPALVSKYVNDMYNVFRQQERDYKVDPEYMTKKQSFINDRMRCILIDWLVEVHLKFKMVPETLYLTASIIDRYLEVKEVRRSRLQLVGVSALLIAAKYEEIYPPVLKDLVYITDRAYTKHEIVEMENEIIVTLNYDFTIPTAHSFLCRYLKAAHADRSIVQMACYLTERTLQEYSMLQFMPSVIAATSVMIARKSLQRFPWSSTLLQYTGYDEPDLEACAKEMEKILTATDAQQTAIKRKYSTSRFGIVASLPLVFN